MNRNLSNYLPSIHIWGPIKIAGIYLILGVSWILLSDRLLARIASEQEIFARISTYKGWGYVLVTAILLYWLIQRHTVAILNSERRTKLITDALPVLISYVDSNKCYRFNNRTYQNWFGHDATGRHIEDVLGTEAYHKISGHVNAALAGRLVHYQTNVPYKNAGTRLVDATYVPDTDANGVVRGFYALVYDMTERKEAEEELRLWADAFEGCAHGIAIIDPTTNRILACNPAFANMHRYRVDELVGNTVLSLYTSSELKNAKHQIEKADQIGHVQFEATNLHKDGSTFLVQKDLISVRGDDGEILYRVATALDITERKQAEDDLHRLNEELEQRVRARTSQLENANRELEAFSYSVSHDLRTPLRAIDGYTNILVEDYQSVLDEEGRRVCEVISTETRHMGQLIDDLLAFSRLSRAELHTVKMDMNELVRSSFDELTLNDDKERIDFKVGNLPAAHGDGTLIRQVWMNLLANAIKFTSRKTRALIEVDGIQEKDETVYYVRDNGAGFDMEYADKLFGVFQRLHSGKEFEGTGVGLAIVQGVIRRHGGRVWAEGKVDQGATFYFVLPRKSKD